MSTARAGSMDVVVGDGVRTCLLGGASTMTENAHTTFAREPRAARISREAKVYARC